MKLITPFDPSIPAASGIIDTQGINNNEQLMLYNDSLYGLQLTFPDGSIDVIPPSWNKDFILSTVPMTKVKWTVYNQIVATGYPMSQVYGTIYEPEEHVASVNAGMQRGFTLTGGGLSTATIIDDGNAVGHEFLESTVLNAPGSTWSLFNDGNNSFIGVLIANVVHKLIQIANTGNLLKLGDPAQLSSVEILAGLLVDGAITVNSPIITVNGSTSGTMIVTMPIQGNNIKLLIVEENTFKVGTAISDVAIQRAFTNGAILLTSDIAGIGLKNGASLQTITYITSLATSGGTTGTNTALNSYSFAFVPAFDTLSPSSSNTSTHTGLLIAIGY